MMQFDQHAKELFATHKYADVIYFTSDGNAFFNLLPAKTHTQRLKDKSITDLYRDNEAKKLIEAKLASQAAEYKNGIEVAFTMAFPELARIIKQNAGK